MTVDLPRRIGINAIFLEARMGGIETYLRALVPELVRLSPEIRYSVYCSPAGRRYLESEGWGEGIELVTPPLIGRRGLKAIGEATVLGAIAGRRVDLLHSVAMTAPLRTRAVNVISLPDVIWIVAPTPGEAVTVRVWRAVVPAVARRADRLITGSRDAAEQVAEHLRVPRERIDVVPHGAGVSARVAATPETELRSRLGLGEGPIVLTVSAKKVHKNLVRLLEAMPEVLARVPDAMLVMPGNPTPHEGELKALADRLGIAAHVSLPPYVSAADLEGLYAAAGCFVFPSYSEGFGLPVLEAMQRGVAVACSRASAIPEVAGDAALYFDPLDTGSIAEAMLTLLLDRPQAERLIAAGLVQAARFTWEKAAEGTLESYARAWRERGRRS